MDVGICLTTGEICLTVDPAAQNPVPERPNEQETAGARTFSVPRRFSAGIPAAAAGSVRDHAAGPPRVGAAAQLARFRVDEDGLGAAEVQVVIGANVDAGVAHGGQLLPHRLGN